MGDRITQEECIKFLLDYCSSHGKKHESDIKVSNLNPEAKVFEWKVKNERKLNPAAAMFVPKAEQEPVSSDVIITVTSTLYQDLIAKYRISTESPKLSLVDVQKYFPSAVDLFYMEPDQDGRNQLVSVKKCFRPSGNTEVCFKFPLHHQSCLFYVVHQQEVLGLEEFRGQLEALSNKMGECQNQLSIMREKLAAEVLLNYVKDNNQTFAVPFEANPDHSDSKDDSGISCDSVTRNDNFMNAEEKNDIVADKGNHVENS